MIEDVYDSAARGLALVLGGEVDEGMRALMNAVAEVSVDSREFDAVLGLLWRAFETTKDLRGLSTVAWYFGAPLDDARLLRGPPRVDIARTHRLLGDESSAARCFEDAGLLAHAAIARERADEIPRARALWTRLASQLEGGGDSRGSGPSGGVEEHEDHLDHGERAAEQRYVLGLVRFDVARCSQEARGAQGLRCDRGRRDAIVSAVSALEDAAGRFEALGRRERAHDCYNALAAIGETSGTFEHVLEGRVNATRILCEDHLHRLALRALDESITVAEQANELAAAAAFAREAMGYARSLGFAADAAAYARRALDLHAETARAVLREGGPVDLADSALLAAIALAADLGLLSRARELYVEASGSPALDEARRARYARAAAMLADVPDDEGGIGSIRARGAMGAKGATGPVDSTSRRMPPLEVWHIDVLEWEQRGRAEEACAEILFDARPQGKTAADRAREVAYGPLRRRALLARLIALQLGQGVVEDPSTATAVACELVRTLSTILDYRVLAPLEALARHSAPEVRVCVADAAGAIPYKRSAQLLRSMSNDANRSVVSAVARAVATKHNPIFIDPLRRLARDASHPIIRAAALRALAGIDNAEAAEAVLSALEAGSLVERRAIIDALKRKPRNGSRLAVVARARIAAGVPPELARDLRTAMGDALDGED